MKIWITRDHSFSIQCGGLERLHVWFREPRYIEKWDLTGQSGRMPFDDETPKAGIRLASHWEVIQSGNMHIDRSVSFGKLFGYDNGEHPELVEYVWNKLSDHFGNVPFEKWHEYEKSHKKCCVSKFILELDIKITF